MLDRLRERGCQTVIRLRSREYDLVSMDAFERLYCDAKPVIGIHLAARVRSIGANQTNRRLFTLDRRPRVTFGELIRMVENDLRFAEEDAVVRRHGHHVQPKP